MERTHLDFLVERLKPVRFAPGEAVTDPDAGPAQWFYILHQGLIVGEEQGEDERISGNAWELVPGECFPLGALVDERPVRNVQRADGEVVCLTMQRAAFEELRDRSRVFDAFCRHRLGGLVEQARRQVQAEAVRDLGDTSLNIALGEKALRAPLTCGPEAPIREALAMMSRERVGSTVVVDGEGRPIGIFTLKDLMNRVALGGVGLDAPIEAVMTRDPVAMPRSAFAFEAAMAMAHHGIHHLCVVEEGRLVGVISERDLFSMQRVGLVNLSKSVGRAGRVPELATIAGDIHQLVAQMMAQGVKVGQITAIITLLNDQIVERVLELIAAETPGIEGVDVRLARLRQRGAQRADAEHRPGQRHPVRGAGGGDGGGGARAAPAVRGPGEPGARRDRLHALPRRDHGAQPRELPELRGMAGAVREMGRAGHAGASAEGVDLLRLPRDLGAGGGGAGAAGLADGAGGGEHAVPAADGGERAGERAAAGGIFRDFRLSGEGAQSNTIDLKINGVAIFIDAARIWALAQKVPATNTVERLEGVAAKGGLSKADLAAWTDAYDYIRMLRMRVNQEQAAAGQALSNRVAPERLNELDRRILKEAFREARRLQGKLAQDYQLCSCRRARLWPGAASAMRRG
jgi:CBS domain-containing protein